jgi:hypothetical protein
MQSVITLKAMQSEVACIKAGGVGESCEASKRLADKAETDEPVYLFVNGQADGAGAGAGSEPPRVGIVVDDSTAGTKKKKKKKKKTPLVKGAEKKKSKIGGLDAKMAGVRKNSAGAAGVGVDAMVDPHMAMHTAAHAAATAAAAAAAGEPVVGVSSSSTHSETVTTIIQNPAAATTTAGTTIIQIPGGGTINIKGNRNSAATIAVINANIKSGNIRGGGRGAKPVAASMKAGTVPTPPSAKERKKVMAREQPKQQVNVQARVQQEEEARKHDAPAVVAERASDAYNHAPQEGEDDDMLTDDFEDDDILGGEEEDVEGEGDEEGTFAYRL